MRDWIPKAIIGLGNPGAGFAATRHNAGFMVIDALAQELVGTAWSKKCRSLVKEAQVADRRVVLVKPLTYMNLSGAAVEALREECQLELKDLLLVLDDLNLPLGRIRVRRRGSAGGHNGLESVLQTVGSDEILRLRLGIGEEDLPAARKDFVLAEFPPEREADLREMIRRACEAVHTILSDGVAKAMSVFNA